MIATKALITVKTLSKKHFDQIEKTSYDWNPGSRFRTIWEALMTDKAAVLGYVPGDSFSRISSVRFWLVKMGPHLVFWPAPDKGELFDKYAGPELEQLFVG